MQILLSTRTQRLTVIFILRLYSIYSKRTFILYGFGALLLAELGVKIVRA